MSRLEALGAFFSAWEEANAHKKPGRPTPEAKAAQELLALRAAAVRQWKAEAAAVSPLSAEAQEYRRLHQQIAASYD